MAPWQRLKQLQSLLSVTSKSNTIAIQTDLTLSDIIVLESLAEGAVSQPGEDIISTVIHSDEWVEFYTGVESRHLLQGSLSLVIHDLIYFKPFGYFFHSSTLLLSWSRMHICIIIGDL